MNRKRHIFPAFYFYPRPPRGGRRSRWSRGRGCRNFYPRPPRGGRRPELQCCCTKRRIFLSTPSARRATLCLVVTFHFRDISIHALREEGDVRNCSAAARSAGYFYPRPPRGGRRFVLSSRSISVIFLSTPSARRATLYNRSQQNGYSISIHALREEGDERNTGDYRLGGGHFYPRPPRGGRPHSFQCGRPAFQFLSTPSARRAT